MFQCFYDKCWIETEWLLEWKASGTQHNSCRVQHTQVSLVVVYAESPLGLILRPVPSPNPGTVFHHFCLELRLILQWFSYAEVEWESTDISLLNKRTELWRIVQRISEGTSSFISSRQIWVEIPVVIVPLFVDWMQYKKIIEYYY